MGNFVVDIITNLNDRFSKHKSDSVFGRAQIFKPEKFPSNQAETLLHGDGTVKASALFYELDPTKMTPGHNGEI